jgi:quercetin dioxygenase-like cupin family protein
VARIELGFEIEGMGDRVLRQNRATLSPGGATALHQHIEQPEIIFVVAGRVIDYQGTESREYGPGESYTVTKGVSHWLENRGTEPATLIATFIAKRR